MATNRPIASEPATVRTVVSGLGGNGLRFAARITVRVLLFLILVSSALSVAFLAFSVSSYRVKWLPSDPRVAGALSLLPFISPIWSVLRPGKMSIWIGIFTLLPAMVVGFVVDEAEAISHLVIFLSSWYLWAFIQLRSLR